MTGSKVKKKNEIMKTFVFLIFKSNIFFENKISCLSFLLSSDHVLFLLTSFRVKKAEIKPRKQNHNLKIKFLIYVLNKLFLNGKCLQAKLF